MNKLIKIIVAFVMIITFLGGCSEDTVDIAGVGVVTGQVVEATTFEPIENAKITLTPTNNSTFTDVNGEFSFELDCGEETFTAVGTKASLKQGTELFTIDGNNSEVKLKLELEPEEVFTALGQDLGRVLELNPIYFDFDKSFIRPDARIELEKVIAFMREYPSLNIDVRSHTDSRAPDDYNVALSQRRNKSTREYLINRGINQSRLSGRGYGETQLLNECSNGVKCTKDQHQLNRRSEFIVVKN